MYHINHKDTDSRNSSDIRLVCQPCFVTQDHKLFIDTSKWLHVLGHYSSRVVLMCLFIPGPLQFGFLGASSEWSWQSNSPSHSQDFWIRQRPLSQRNSLALQAGYSTKTNKERDQLWHIKSFSNHFIHLSAANKIFINTIAHSIFTCTNLTLCLYLANGLYYL